MILEVGKIYLTRHGRFAKIDFEPWQGIFNGEYEEDGRHSGFGSDVDRWKVNGKCWNFLFMAGDFYIPEHDIIMEDCEEARQIAADMKLERKQKAYKETK